MNVANCYRAGLYHGHRGDGNDSNLLVVFYVQIMPDDFVMQLLRADDDVTARLYARGYRLRPEFFKWRKMVLRQTPIMRAVARHPTPFMAISMIF